MISLPLPTMTAQAYQPRIEPRSLHIDPVECLMIQGYGSTLSPFFSECLETLFGVAFPLKFHQKAMGNSFDLPHLEGIWWTENGKPVSQVREEEWHWKLFFTMPNTVEKYMLDQTLDRIEEKGRLKQLHRLDWMTLNEGMVVQALHLGAYAQERGTIARMQLYMELNNLEICGHHHEIYLNDPRITNKDQLRTILRYPVRQRD
ncbi:MAG: hypothetical protein ACFB10_08995 [Salibacteraceae bacterium]